MNRREMLIDGAIGVMGVGTTAIVGKAEEKWDMTNEEIFKRALVQQGINSNIVVYDADAPRGLFTKRLVGLLKVVAGHSYGKYKVEKILVPSELKLSNNIFISEPRDRWIYPADSKFKCFGVEIQFCENFTDLVKEFQGSIATDDDFALLVLCNNGKVFMGSC